MQTMISPVETLFRSVASMTRRAHGFSLVEVVVALGVCSFVMVALLGVLMTGLQSEKDSAERVDAAHTVSLILAQRRSYPIGSISNAGLPSLVPPTSPSTTVTGTANVGVDGQVISSGQAPYLLTYQIDYSVPNLAQIHLVLSWPSNVSLNQTQSDQRYEVVSQIKLK